MCVYRHIKANVDIRAVWEDDLGGDDMGQILEQPDAGHSPKLDDRPQQSTRYAGHYRSNFNTV